MLKPIDVKELKILGHTYTVKYDPNYSNSNTIGDVGSVNFETGTIYIDNSMVNWEELLFHEIIHIVKYHFKIEDEEDDTWRLSEGLFQIFKDNALYFGEDS